MTEVRCTMNARGGFIESDAPYLVESPGTGAGVMLTLDSSIQRACEAVGIEMVDKGCIVVLDAPTGRVRASVSLPLYDPENVAASIARQDTSLVNRALSAYNVGSVFKPLLAAAALPFGRVYVAAPQSQCSGMSQKLTIRGTLAVEQADFPVPVEAAWAVGGTPADCVKAAVKALVPCRPDVVLTGVNQGWNAGLDIAYSGTIGAALEGVMNGIPAIAFSAREFCDPGAMEVYLPRVLQELLQALPKPGTLWNVNFPDCAASACKGILRGRVPAACSFYDNEYDRAEGALSIRVSNPGPEQCREGSDIHAILHGYVSIGEVRSPLF